jgi:hypothetical protein
MEKYKEQFNGRSVFFKPPAWPSPPIVKVPDDDDNDIPPPPPTPPEDKIYTGPGILYALGDVIRFKAKSASEKPLDIRVGEEKNGVRVISTNLPWTVRVGYRSKEWDVPIFNRGEDKFLLAQAKPIEIIRGLLEIPPQKPVVEAPKSTGTPDEVVVTPPAGENRDPRETARGNRGTRRGGGARPEGARPTPPPRAASPAPQNNEDEEADAEEAAADKEVAEEEEVEEDEEDQPRSANPPTRGRGVPSTPPQDEDDEDEDADMEPNPRTRQAPTRPQPSPQRPR